MGSPVEAREPRSFSSSLMGSSVRNSRSNDVSTVHFVLSMMPIKLCLGMATGTLLRFALAFMFTNYQFTNNLPVPFNSSPAYTNNHIKECNFLLAQGLDIYSAGEQSCRVMPLLVIIFANMNLWGHVMVDIFLVIALYLLAQEIVSRPTPNERGEFIGISECLKPIAAGNKWIYDVILSGSDCSRNEETEKKALVAWSELPTLISLLYYCNPFSIALCASESHQAVVLLSYAITLLAARKGMCGISALSVAVGASLEIYPVVLLIPVIFMCSEAQSRRSWIVFQIFGFFTLSLVGLLYVSYSLAGNLNFFNATILWNFSFTDLSPNIGVLWYQFTMTFHIFRMYFRVMSIGLPFLFIIPFSLRLHTQPIALASSLMMMWALLRPCPNCHEVFFVLPLFLLSPFAVIRMRQFSVICFISSIVPISLLCLDYWQWLIPGTGNANYIFFQSLSTMVLLFAVLIDFIAANVKHIKSVRLTKAASSIPCDKITSRESNLLLAEISTGHDKDE